MNRDVYMNDLMTEAIAFDTHRFVKRLTKNGFSEQQAETLAEEQVALINTNLATKTDVEALRLATKADIETAQQATKADVEALRQATKSEFEALRQATKSDIEVLRQATKSDIERSKSELIKWVFAALIAQGGLIVALGKVL